MRVAFAHTVEDFVEASRARISRRHGRGQSRKIARLGHLMAGLLVACPVLMLPSAIYLGFEQNLLWFLPALFLFIVVAFIARYLIPKWGTGGLRRQFAADPRNTDPAAAEIDDAGFHFLGSAWECHVEWSRVVHYHESPSLLILVDDTPSRFFIPKRAFATEAHMDEFRRRVLEYLSSD